MLMLMVLILMLMFLMLMFNNTKVKQQHPNILTPYPSNFLPPNLSISSFTSVCFMDYCIHFVRYLPEGFGKGGKPAILVLDGHSSRWDLAALLYLRDNNVHGIVIPSHTSIFSQVNDIYINKALKKQFAESFAAHRLSPGNSSIDSIGKLTRSDLTQVLAETFLAFEARLKKDLMETSVNTITKSCEDTGMRPFNINSRTWLA